MADRTNRSLLWWSACIVVLAFFWAGWLNGLGTYALTSDEAAMALMADRADAGIERQNEDSPHVPVYSILLRVWRITVGGQNEYLLRLPSALLGVVLLALMYRLGRRLALGRRESLIGMVLIGLNPQIAVHLREARPYPPMLVSMGLAALAGLRFTHLRSRWLAGAASLLAMLTHYFCIPFVAALDLWGLWAYRGRARRDWVLSQGAAIVLMGIWMPLMGRAFFSLDSLNTGKTWSFLLPPWETLARLAAVGAQGYREFLTSPWSIPAAILLVAGLLVGGLSLEPRRRWFLWALGGGSIVAYAILTWVRPVYHPKYMLPWLIFATLGLAAWVRSRPRSGGIVALALGAMMFLPTFRTWQLSYDPGVVDTPDSSTAPADLSRALLQIAGPNDAFGLGTPDPVHCYYMQHYYPDRSLGCELFPTTPEQGLVDLEGQATQIFATYDVLWYLDYHNPFWDPQNLALTALNQTAVALGDEQVGGQHLLLYGSAERIASQAQANGARFGGVAELRTAWARAGQQLHVVLSWRGLVDHPERDVKVFVHLVDSSGVILSQSDAVPANWTRPLSTWVAGEDVVDVHVLDIPTGTDLQGLSLRIGIYDATTQERLQGVGLGGEPLDQDAAVVGLKDLIDEPKR